MAKRRRRNVDTGTTERLGKDATGNTYWRIGQDVWRLPKGKTKRDMAQSRWFSTIAAWPLGKKVYGVNRRRNPACSAAQRRLFATALAVKRGRTSRRRVTAAARRLARLPEKTLRRYATVRRRRKKNPTLRLVGVPARVLRGLRSRNPFDWATVATGIASGAGAAVGGALIGRALKRRNPGRASGLNPINLNSLTSRAISRLIDLDKKLIGTPDYIGAAYFWDHAYRHYLRDASETVRRKTHNKLLRLGLSPTGKGRRHEAVIKASTSRARKRNTRSYSHNPLAALSNPPGQSWTARLLPAPAAKRFPGYATAAAGYRRFHGSSHDPAHTFLVRLRDGSKKTTKRAVFTVGEAPEVHYQTLRGTASNKAATKGGRRIVWRHLFGEGAGGKKPLLVHDPKSGVSSYIGGAYKVSDWFHK